MLFSFTGERLAEKRTPEKSVKGGTITITGTAGDPSLTFAEQPTVQTKISGKVFFTTHRSIVGTGSLFAFLVEQQNLLEQFHQQNKHCSRLLEILRTKISSTMLVLVHSENYLVLQNLSPSIQTRSRCSSRSLEKEFPRRELPEKSVKVELSRYLESQVFFSLLLITGEGTIPVTGDTSLPEQETLLDLVLSENYLVQQNLLPSIQQKEICSSPLQENALRKEQHSENLEPQASLPSLEQAAILSSHSQSNHSLILMLLVIPLIFVPVHIKVQEPYSQSTMEMKHSQNWLSRFWFY